MKIAIDSRRAVAKVKTGVNWYAYNLIHSLAKIDTENSYLLYHFQSRDFIKKYESFKSQMPVQNNFTVKLVRFHSELARMFQEKFLPAEFFIGKTDIIHIPFLSVPLAFRAKTVVTVHDLIYLIPEAEEWMPPEIRKKMGDKISQSILKSDKIITISNLTKSDILKYFSVNPSKISVIPLACDTIFRTCEDANKTKSILKKYGITGKYLFFTGTLYPRKNLFRLISSFEKIKGSFKEYQLVISGNKRWLYEKILEKIDRLPADIKKDIILTEYVPQHDIPYLYAGASVYMYVSLYEGFGLPILEAMSCGCPVITSNVSSMPEVAGDAAILVDPYSVEEISSAIERVLSDERLREELIKKGFQRAKMFSWQKTAEETLQVYNEVLKEG